jgi:hypothetical protein
MSPAAHALDRRLAELREAYDTVAADLAGLQGGGTYAVLAAGALISGVTAARAGVALAGATEVREGLDQLGALLEIVVERRGWGPVDEPTATELFTHLNGPSIALRTGGWVSPQDLVEAMAAAIEPLRSMVGEVDAVWRDLPLRVNRACAEADRLGEAMPTFSEVVAARSALAALEGRVIHDPLGAADTLAGIEAALAAAAEAGARLPALHAELAAAAETLGALEEAIASGRDALARSRIEIADAGPQLLDPVDPAVLDGERGLRPWLARLEGLVTEGRVDLATKGLISWATLADKTLATARQVAEANAGPTRRRRELAALLRAARVKAGASGQAEDPRTTELAREADRALAVPCHLATAEARVAVYLDELRRAPTPAQAQVRGVAPAPQEKAS